MLFTKNSIWHLIYGQFRIKVWSCHFNNWTTVFGRLRPRRHELVIQHTKIKCIVGESLFHGLILFYRVNLATGCCLQN